MTAITNNFTLVTLAQGVSVVQRGPGMLQFGLDATRTGVMETEHAGEVAAVLERVRSELPVYHLTHLLRQHVGSLEARSIVSDLVSYRIVVPAFGPQAVLIGDSPLAAALGDLLRASGMRLITPLEGEPVLSPITEASPWLPLIAVDQFAGAEALARLAKHRAGPVIPVAQLDSRVFIGPLRLQPHDACPACANLHHADRDAGWFDAVEALPTGPASADPVVLAAGAAVAATVVRSLAGVPDPPGVSAQRVAPGQCLTVDPFGPRVVSKAVMRTHSRCPVCY